MGFATKIKFGDHLDVIDEGAGVIRVDADVVGELEWEDVGTTGPLEPLLEASISGAWASVPPTTEIFAQWGSFDFGFIETISDPAQRQITFKTPGVYAITGSVLAGSFLPTGGQIRARPYVHHSLTGGTADGTSSAVQGPNFYVPYALVSVINYFSVDDWFKLSMEHSHTSNIDLRPGAFTIVRVGTPVP